MPSVLVVDDTPSIRLLIRTNLELEGFEVEEAVDGLDCLDRMFGGKPLPDVLTVDIVMPRLDGLETVAALRADPRTASTLIVMVTTQAQAIDVQRSKKAGVDAYVTKPFDPDYLVQTIKEVYQARHGSIVDPATTQGPPA
ncbi:response regulator [Aeromicrobium sp.]